MRLKINKIIAQNLQNFNLELLKMNNVVNIYDNNFDLNVKKKVRNWNEFFELIKKYTKIFI